MTDEKMAARAIGYLEGISAVLWTCVVGDEKLACEYADAYDRAVETLRKAVFEKEGEK